MLPNWQIWDFGLESFAIIQNAMRQQLDRAADQPQLWLGEHPLVVSRGLRGRNEPVFHGGLHQVQATRGGLLTLHLPGQLVFYPIFKLEPYASIHEYVFLLEQLVINLLQSFNIKATRHEGAPGVYTEQGKIASIGLRVSQGIVHHGLSLNISCPLAPFSWLVCCGQPDLTFTSFAAHSCYPSLSAIKGYLVEQFFHLLLKD